MVLTGIVGYFARFSLGGITSAIGVVGALLGWGAVAGYYALRISEPIRLMSEPLGAGKSLSSRLAEARADLMNDIHDAAIRRPTMDQEGLDEIENLVKATSKADWFLDVLASARKLRARYLIGIILGIPFILGVGVAASLPPQSLMNAVFTVFIVALVYVLAWAQTYPQPYVLIAWSDRVSDLCDCEVARLKLMLLSWAREDPEGWPRVWK